MELDRDARGEVIGPGAVRFERALPGPVGRVWSYLVEPARRGEWFASGPIEPRVGGALELRFRHADLSAQKAPTPERFKSMDEGQVGRARVTRFEPERALGFAWEEEDGSESGVLIELETRGEGTKLTLTHDRLRDEALMVSVLAGWHVHLRILGDRLGGDEPRPFWPAYLEAERAYAGLVGAGD